MSVHFPNIKCTMLNLFIPQHNTPDGQLRSILFFFVDAIRDRVLMITIMYVNSYLTKNNWYYINSPKNTGRPLNQKHAIKIKKKEMGKHRKWVQNCNKDVSHFGLHSNLILLSAIWCDVFHLGCLVGRHMVLYLRSLFKQKGYVFEAKLFNILKTIWSEGVLCLWRLNKPFSQLLGVKIKKIILKCSKIATLFRSPGSGLRQT